MPHSASRQSPAISSALAAHPHPWQYQKFDIASPDMQKINRRPYTSLTRIILATIPCYCRGLIATRHAPPFVIKTPVSTQSPSVTPQPTTYPTATTAPTETMTPTLTYTAPIPPSLTPSFTSAPTPTASLPSLTSTETVIEMAAPTSSATHTLTARGPFNVYYIH